MSLKGKTALITGASAGIGEATALALAQKEVKVLAVARRKDPLEALAQKSKNIEPVVLDINQDLQSLEKLIVKNKIDILINNAGLALGRASIENTSAGDIDTMYQTNILSLIKMTRLVVPQMIERKSGDIVNIGSIASVQAYAGGSIYGSTKAAVSMFTDALRLDLLGKGIRVIGIHPGMVETEFSLVRHAGDKNEAKKVYAGMRPLTGFDIADSIIWSLERPPHIDIHSLIIMPTDQAGVSSVHRET